MTILHSRLSLDNELLDNYMSMHLCVKLYSFLNFPSSSTLNVSLGSSVSDRCLNSLGCIMACLLKTMSIDFDPMDQGSQDKQAMDPPDNLLML